MPGHEPRVVVWPLGTGAELTRGVLCRVVVLGPEDGLDPADALPPDADDAAGGEGSAAVDGLAPRGEVRSPAVVVWAAGAPGAAARVAAEVAAS